MITGNSKGVRNYVRQAISQGIEAERIVEEGLLAGMTEITELYKNNQMFIPDLLVAVKTMSVGMDAIEACYSKIINLPGGDKGKVVIGTVAGDIHDIGKNLVAMMLKNNGFQVYDLGVDVDDKTFVDKAEAYEADIICMSATLTTTMPCMEEVIRRLIRKKIRSKYIVMVGGAPVTEYFAHRIGADLYSPNAAEAVEMAYEAMKNKKN